MELWVLEVVTHPSSMVVEELVNHVRMMDGVAVALLTHGAGVITMANRTPQ